MRQALLPLTLALCMAGCAGDAAFRQAQTLMAQGRNEDSMRQLSETARRHPDDLSLRAFAYQETGLWIKQLLREAGQALSEKDFDRAAARYDAVLQWDANSPEARDGQKRLRQMRIHTARLESINRLINTDGATAMSMLRQILAEDPGQSEARDLLDMLEAKAAASVANPPRLAAALQSRVSLRFSQQSLSSLFGLISQIAKVNFVFDKDVPQDLTATIYAQDTTAEDAISYLLQTNQLDRKIVNETTMLIYPNRPEKTRLYKDLVMRTFYLSNADPLQVATLVRQMANPRLIHADPRLNMVVVRDTPESMDVIEKLIRAQDIPQSELMLEVEVLEVNSSDVLDMGIHYPASIGFSPSSSSAQSASADSSPATSGRLTLDDLRHINQGNILVSLGSPAVSLGLSHARSHSKVLANPHIRVKNREKAVITIGDRIPVVTTTTNNGVTSENISYLDVGLSLRVEPNLSLEEDIGIKINLEVSNVVKTITSKTGLVAYQLGQRKAETVLTSHDGETQVLAGLLSRNDGEQGDAIPGLGSLPLLDRLFGNRLDSKSKTEIMLLVTPHIVRNLPMPPAHVTRFNSGIEPPVNPDALRMNISPTVPRPSGERQ